MSRRWRIRLQFDPHDFWVGVYWTTEVLDWPQYRRKNPVLYTFFVVIIPCFPIVIQWRGK